jgi:hypothetical protein
MFNPCKTSFRQASRGRALATYGITVRGGNNPKEHHVASPKLTINHYATARDHGGPHAAAVDRAQYGIEPNDGDAFEQIQCDVEQDEAERGLSEMLLGKAAKSRPKGAVTTEPSTIQTIPANSPQPSTRNQFSFLMAPNSIDKYQSQHPPRLKLRPLLFVLNCL